ncbi:hypothetical protein [Streptomyces rubradiris]|uniref:Uncharacterized protein n=1 Tax=Streptomyces rubradiris TaxID=285531 RepID=A0ABQ3RBG6_STRRR|nr:hypothetical protein [Streptomyces rubradiris]GHH19750.1 hypothetical protein GCM10018792_52970 [Streptomyces rubradiris]GHI53163.1 hypothetical protein Srubr_30090 [Streptomyces rubradiris]
MPPETTFIDYVRRRRWDLVRPDAPAAAADEVLTLLGLDDASLTRWAASGTVLVSLPHASPNVFDPRTRVCWYAGTLQRRQADPPHHLRVVLPHINFSDLGWRPYAWWYLDEDGKVRCHRQFSRNKKRKHVTVASQPPMDVTLDGATPTDLHASRVARWGADLAVSYMLVGSVVERAAGMVPGPVATYLPLSLLVSFVQEHAADSAAVTGESGVSLLAWCRLLTGQAQGRRVGPDGVLVECPAREATVFDNYSNLAMLSLLGDCHVLGGAKMAGYWPHVQRRVDALRQVAVEDMRDPRVVVVPDADLLRFAGPSPAVAEQLERQGVPYSQGLAVVEHGGFAERVDPFEPVGSEAG